MGSVLRTNNAKERKEFLEADRCPGFGSVRGGDEELEATVVQAVEAP